MDPQVNTMLLVYNPEDGRPKYTAEWPWPDDLEDIWKDQGLSCIVAPKAMANDVWVDLSGDEPKAYLRKRGPWVVGDRTLPVGGTFTVANIPENTHVTVGPETYTINDGEFQFVSQIAGTFKITIENWPLKDSVYEVTYED